MFSCHIWQCNLQPTVHCLTEVTNTNSYRVSRYDLVIEFFSSNIQHSNYPVQECTKKKYKPQSSYNYNKHTSTEAIITTLTRTYQRHGHTRADRGFSPGCLSQRSGNSSSTCQLKAL